jgi:hypothetical protein
VYVIAIGHIPSFDAWETLFLLFSILPFLQFWCETLLKLETNRSSHARFPIHACSQRRLGTSQHSKVESNLVPRACNPWEGTRGSGIIRCRKPGIMAKIELPWNGLSPRIAGSGNEIEVESRVESFHYLVESSHSFSYSTRVKSSRRKQLRLESESMTRHTTLRGIYYVYINVYLFGKGK